MYHSIFLVKVYCEVCCGGAKKWDAMFLCRSLLLSTIILNDVYMCIRTCTYIFVCNCVYSGTSLEGHSN